MPYLGIFGLELQKNYCHISSQHPGIGLIAKVCEIMKIPKFGTKMPYLSIFELEFENNIVSTLIEHFQICLIAEFREKMETPKFTTKNALFRYIWAIILKNYCHT